MSADAPPDTIAEGTTPAAVLGRIEEGVCALDSDWQFTYVNQQAATLLGRDPSPLLGESLWEQFPGVVDSPASEALYEAVETGEPRQFDMECDPRGVWLSVHAYPSTEGLTVCFRDVTDERQRELEHQHSQRLFEAVFDDTNDALVVADTDRRITDFNAAAEELFGYEADEVIGERSRLLYAEESAFEQQGDERFNKQASEHHERYVVEYERADGTTFEGETVGTPLEGPDGETFAFLGAIRDVTSQVAYERDIERRNRALKQFHDITTDEREPFEAQIGAVLELASDYLDLETGLLAAVDGQEYTVEHACTADEPIEAGGTTFDLSETFCEQVLDRDSPVGFASTAAAKVTAHPAHESQGLAAYLGAPVYVHGEPYGTINFSSSDPREHEITESEETFVRLVAQWAGKEMSRRLDRNRANAERERLRQIIDALPQQVFLKDASGTYTLANEAAAEAHDVTVETLEGATDDVLTFESDDRDFQADDATVIEHGEEIHIEEDSFVDARGTEHIVQTDIVPFETAFTERQALVVTTDITEQKRLEAQLDQSQQRLRQIIDMLPQLVFAKDESGTFLLANEAVAEAYGTTVEELEGATDVDFADSEAEIEQFRADDRAVIESGEPKYIPEEPLTTADGTEKILATKKIPYDPVDTAGEAVLGVSTEITERKEREAELEMQSAAMEASMDGISVLDADGEYIYMNEAHAAVFDYGPEDLLGNSWQRLYADDDVERLEREVFPELEAQGQWRGETVGVRRDGTPVDQEITLSLLNDGKLICTNRDITERKARQSELEQYEALVESMNEVAFIVDADCRLAYANEQALTYAGVSAGDVVGGAMADLVEQLSADERASSTFMDALETTLDGVRVDERHELRLDTGTDEYVMEYLFSPFRSRDEQRAAVVARDVTKQKAREQELERNQTRLRALFDESPDGIIVHDERGEILDANTTQTELLGYDADELGSMNVAELEVGHSRQELRNLWREMDAGETRKVEGDHRRKAGTIYPVEVWISRTELRGQPRFIAISRDITDRKSREREMIRNREFLERTQEIASVGGWELDTQQGQLRWTDEVYRIHDLPPDTEITVEDGLSYYHPDDRQTITEAFERLVEAGEPYDLELRIVTPADEIRWVRTVADPQLEDGAVVGVRGIFQDITDRKRLEESLRDNERSLREVTKIASDADRGFEEKLGAVLELGCDRLGLPYGFLNRIEDDRQHTVEARGTHPDLQTGASASLSKGYCRHTIERDEPLAIQSAVEEGWEDDPAYETFGLGCYIGGNVFVDGELYGTLCFADDDDRDHQFEESERAFVELLVQWIGYELAGETVETRLRELNQTAQRLLSASDADEVASIAIESAKEVLDLPLTGIWWYDEEADELVPTGVTDEVSELLDEQPVFTGNDSLAMRTFRHGEVGVYDDLQREDGRFNAETPMQSEMILPLGDHGVLISGSTQQRAFSETDAGLFEILGATVETALSRAEREQVLRDTREQLEQSNQELEQFAYAASHDLQEPLRTISSYLTLLERRYGDGLDDDAVEFIDFAVDGADRMREMIQALLAYSRVDTRGEAFEHTDMSGVFDTVTRNLEVTIEEADATLELPDAAGHIVGDTSQLVQLFQNLVENAIKYSEGNPHVDISVIRSDDIVEYAVADDGIGIDPGQLDDIFEVFQRLHTRAEFDGTGIGLSLCEKIVDRHGGEIRVESTPGEGSTFFVTLPVAGESRE